MWYQQKPTYPFMWDIAAKANVRQLPSGQRARQPQAQLQMFCTEEV